MFKRISNAYVTALEEVKLGAGLHEGTSFDRTSSSAWTTGSRSGFDRANESQRKTASMSDFDASFFVFAQAAVGMAHDADVASWRNR